MEKCVRVYFLSRNKTRLTYRNYNAHSLHSLIALGSWIHCLLPFKLFSGSTWLFYFSHYPAIDGRKVRLYSAPLEIRNSKSIHHNSMIHLHLHPALVSLFAKSVDLPRESNTEVYLFKVI